MSSITPESVEDSEKSHWFFRPKARPAFYMVVLLTVLVVAFATHVRRNTIFACPATGYSDGQYLGYCQANAYGDFDHGAFWFNLEPVASAAAKEAEVLFIGSSRMQFGLSAPSLGRWFDEAGVSYYLMGFSHTENTKFFTPLLEKLKPQARAYVINADGFFGKRMTGPASDLLYGADTYDRYLTKQTLQSYHRRICTWQPALCGQKISFYRERETGEWWLGGTQGVAPADVGPPHPVEMHKVERDFHAADRFIDSLGVSRDCILLTYVPHENNGQPTAAALADALGVGFVSPDIAGLRTFDGSHLDQASAERFTAAFVAEAGPLLQKCLTRTESRAPAKGLTRQDRPVGESRS